MCCFSEKCVRFFFSGRNWVEWIDFIENHNNSFWFPIFFSFFFLSLFLSFVVLLWAALKKNADDCTKKSIWEPKKILKNIKTKANLFIFYNSIYSLCIWKMISTIFRFFSLLISLNSILFFRFRSIFCSAHSLSWKMVPCVVMNARGG